MRGANAGGGSTGRIRATAPLGARRWVFALAATGPACWVPTTLAVPELADWIQLPEVVVCDAERRLRGRAADPVYGDTRGNSWSRSPSNVISMSGSAPVAQRLGVQGHPYLRHSPVKISPRHYCDRQISVESIPFPSQFC